MDPYRAPKRLAVGAALVYGAKVALQCLERGAAGLDMVFLLRVSVFVLLLLLFWPKIGSNALPMPHVIVGGLGLHFLSSGTLSYLSVIRTERLDAAILKWFGFEVLLSFVLVVTACVCLFKEMHPFHCATLIAALNAFVLVVPCLRFVSTFEDADLDKLGDFFAGCWSQAVAAAFACCTVYALHRASQKHCKYSFMAALSASLTAVLSILPCAAVDSRFFPEFACGSSLIVLALIQFIPKKTD